MGKKPAKKHAMPYTRSKDPVKILTTAVRAMREEPLRYWQGWWVLKRKRDGSYASGSAFFSNIPSGLLDEKPLGPACGTVGCIAGLAVAVTTPRGKRMPSSYAIPTRARELLKLDHLPSQRLFNAEAVRGTYGSPAYVERAVRHIERFMRREYGYAGPKL